MQGFKPPEADVGQEISIVHIDSILIFDAPVIHTENFKIGTDLDEFLCKFCKNHRLNSQTFKFEYMLSTPLFKFQTKIVTI